MITRRKIKIYTKYEGDQDAGARGWSLFYEMSDTDWGILERLIQDIILVNNGLASDDYAVALGKRLIENCDSPETIDRLKDLAINKILVGFYLE